MGKKQIGFLALMLVLLALGSVLLAACTRPGTTSTGNTGGGNGASSGGGGGGGGGGEPTVHMVATNFVTSTVTVPKGSKLKLVDDGSFFHIIANGMWDNGTPKPAKEAGAPTVNNAQVDGSSVTSLEIGPFTTAGTFRIYCTVHPGMNLTITVK